MDTKSKVVIAVLVVLGVLFISGLGTNLVFSKKVEGRDVDYRPAWLRTLGRLTEGFSPRLDGSRLRAGPGCRQKNDGFEFSGDGKCNITITALPENSDDDYQTATLRVSNAVTVNVPCPDDQETATTRGAAFSTRLKVIPTVLMKPAHPMASSVSAATISVVYTPTGKTMESPRCTANDPKDEVRLVTRKAGGILMLECRGCSANRKVQVDFKK